MLNWIVWNKTVYLRKMDLALNNLQRLICYKNHTKKQTIICMCVCVCVFYINNSGDVNKKYIYLRPISGEKTLTKEKN